MRWGPVRSIALGGVAFGIVVLIVGVLILLVDQGVLRITLSVWTFCSLLLIAFGLVVIGGVLWARRMAHGGWKKWVEDWDREA